ncbi:hypothetical protein B0H21DRAFT_751389 [Amylocystis lapponica]|nr:hypothetical protein B0H21DRAFT_751389 [Amylocystis lapponica]
MLAESTIGEVAYSACGYELHVDNTVYDAWIMGGRAASMLTDALVLALTWIKVRRIDPATLGMERGKSISGILMRDNAMYFGFFFILNLVGLVLGTNFGLNFVIAKWNSTLTAMLLPRFMLDLREVSAADNDGHNTHTGDLTSILFVNRTHPQDSVRYTGSEP